jgi:hypothetical protein
MKITIAHSPRQRRRVHVLRRDRGFEAGIIPRRVALDVVQA